MLHSFEIKTWNKGGLLKAKFDYPRDLFLKKIPDNPWTFFVFRFLDYNCEDYTLGLSLEKQYVVNMSNPCSSQMLIYKMWGSPPGW